EELTGEWKLTGPSDILVSRDSAIGHYSDRVQHENVGFNQNHSDLPKFKSKYDANYSAVEPFFTHCYNDAFEVIQKRFINEATRPEYNVNSTGRCRLTCQNCQKEYKSQIKLLHHLKGDGNDACYLKAVQVAIISGRLSTASMLLTADKRIEMKNERTGAALLHDAAQIGRLEVVKLLLDRGASVEAKNNDGSTPLHDAAQNGRLDVAKLLLDRGASVKAENKDGSTPLHDAAQNGQLDVAELLLDRGANIEAKNNDSHTPFSLAAQNGRLDVVKLLLGRGANIKANDNGQTSLGFASQNGKADVDEIQPPQSPPISQAVRTYSQADMEMGFSVTWEVGEDVWRKTTPDFQEATGITQFKLYRCDGWVYEYTLEFTSIKNYDY
ncbi:pfs domain-containing protein, partial [Trichoderma gamsii]